METKRRLNSGACCRYIQMRQRSISGDSARGGGRPRARSRAVRSFGTFTGDLHRLLMVRTVRDQDGRDESTGSTGSRFTKFSSSAASRFGRNARDAKHVPGRKTDVSDAAWLQRLHEFGCCEAASAAGCIAALRPICASVSDYWTTQPPTSSICRRHSLR